MNSANSSASDPQQEPSVLEIRDEAINADDIMARIRRAIDEKKAARIYVEESWMRQETNAAVPVNKDHVSADALAMLQMSGRLDLEGAPINSHRPFFGALIKMAKRFSRFWVRKYTDSIFLKQSHFNLETAQTLGRMSEQLRKLQENQEKLQQEVETLQPPVSKKSELTLTSEVSNDESQ